MATSSVNPGASTGGGDFGTLMSALSSVEQEPGGESQPVQESAPPPDAQPAERPQIADAPAESTDQPTEQAAREQEPEVYFPDDASDAHKAVVNDLMKTQEGRDIYNGSRFLRDFSEKIGYQPTVEDAVAAYQDQASLMQLTRDFASGDPKLAASALGHLFDPRRPNTDLAAAQLGPTLYRTNPKAFAHLAQSVLAGVPMIQQKLPQLYQGVERHVLESVKADLLQQVDQFADDDPARQHSWVAANLIHKRLTGEVLSAPPDGRAAALIQQQRQAQQKPVNGREQELAQREQQIRQYESHRQQEAVAARDNAVNQSIAQQMAKEVGDALKTLRGRVDFEDRTSEFTGLVASGVMEDPQAMLRINTALANFRANGSEQALRTAVSEYMKRANFVIRGMRKDFLTQKTAAGKASNDAETARLREITNNASPSGSASVTRAAQPKKLERMEHEDDLAYIMRSINLASA